MQEKLSRREILIELNKILLLLEMDYNELKEWMDSKGIGDLDTSAGVFALKGSLTSKVRILLTNALGLDCPYSCDDFTQYLE